MTLGQSVLAALSLELTAPRVPGSEVLVVQCSVLLKIKARISTLIVVLVVFVAQCLGVFVKTWPLPLQAHYPASCSHMSQWVDDGGFYEGMTSEAQSKHLAKLISKCCPSCQAQIEKNEGCLQYVRTHTHTHTHTHWLPE